MEFAASYGRVFKVDPVDVLDCDLFDWALRMAAMNVVSKQKQAEAERQKKR